jgi:hypothetical protein
VGERSSTFSCTAKTNDKMHNSESEAQLTRVVSSLREGLALGTHLTVIVLGASGDLAKKKTYPALFELFRHDFLPAALDVIGYARSPLSDDDLRTKLKGFLKADEDVVDSFLSKCTYVSGSYDGDENSSGYAALHAKITELEKAHLGNCGRLFYLALPPKASTHRRRDPLSSSAASDSLSCALSSHCRPPSGRCGGSSPIGLYHRIPTCSNFCLRVTCVTRIRLLVLLVT